MLLALRTLYVVGILGWGLYHILLPPWVGISYDGLRSGGTFGLKRADGFSPHSARLRAPIWSPPTAHSDIIHPSVRWPWQSPSQNHHVEISTDELLGRWSLGVIILGLMLRGATWIFPTKKPDALVSVAWSLSVSLIIAWILLFVLIALSAGYGPPPVIASAIFVFAILGGVAYGLAVDE